MKIQLTLLVPARPVRRPQAGAFVIRVATGCAVWMCSCIAPVSASAADLFPPSVSDPFLDDSQPSGRAKTSAANTTSPVGRVRLSAAAGDASGAAGRLARSNQVGSRGARVTFTPAEPRDDVPVRSVGVQNVGHNQAGAHAGTQVGLPDYPDEYLLDGGDRNLPLHREEVGYSGLDTEDTVADYTDSHGKRRTLPSNRVAIYAPRFAAVRTVSAPIAGVAVDKLAATDDFTRTAGMRSRTSPTHHAQRESLEGVGVRSRASGLEAPSITEGLDQTTYATEHVKLLNTFEDLRFIKGGELLRSEKARLALGIQNAVVWNREQYPVATASVEAVHEVVARFRPSELVGVEDRSTPGRLRIVKLADRDTALPGEVVTFTIRYDNQGDHELQELQIIDNLTPRLEYVKASGTTDRDARLDVNDNGEGSSVLTFRLKGPLPGRQGGVLTFKARVR